MLTEAWRPLLALCSGLSHPSSLHNSKPTLARHFFASHLIVLLIVWMRASLKIVIVVVVIVVTTPTPLFPVNFVVLTSEKAQRQDDCMKCRLNKPGKFLKVNTGQLSLQSCLEIIFKKLFMEWSLNGLLTNFIYCLSFMFSHQMNLHLFSTASSCFFLLLLQLFFLLLR